MTVQITIVRPQAFMALLVPASVKVDGRRAIRLWAGQKATVRMPDSASEIAVAAFGFPTQRMNLADLHAGDVLSYVILVRWSTYPIVFGGMAAVYVLQAVLMHWSRAAANAVTIVLGVALIAFAVVRDWHSTAQLRKVEPKKSVGVPA